ncbi:MAG: protein translocase subunit SecD [Treponemataceae bacterium]
MSKRYRFFIVLATVAVCFSFLFPTIRWYFMVPKEQQALALGSREQIKTYATRKAQADLKELKALVQSQNSAALPVKFDFLITNAKVNYKLAKMTAPKVWDAKSVLASFASEREAVDAIESQYRTGIVKLKGLHGNAIQLGLDLSGGMSVIIQANLDSVKEKLGRELTAEDKADAMNRGLEVLNSRIDRFGLTEPVIRRQGENQIYVEIPGAADPERINSIIMGKGKLAFHIVDDDATQAFLTYYAANPTNTFDGAGNLINATVVPADCAVRGFYTKDRYGIDEFTRYIVIKKEVGLDGNHIKSAIVSRDQITGAPDINFVLDTEGGELFYRLTSSNVQKTLAVVMDDKVKAGARIQEPIRDSVRLTGFGQEEATNLALVLRTAALPVELEPVSQQAIGASLGEDTIRQGINAMTIGLVAVMIFMLLWYKGAGFNAMVAQVLNMYLMLSVLSAFSLTLTLPSIAGFLLTVGMSVDTNVIIFERIKEEMLLGKSRKASIDAGFDKAFWAIMDSNITTFIAALFLSQLGTGPIQGFAVSLAIGVLSSMFTGLFVSRLIFDFGTDVLKQTRVSIRWGNK